MHRAPAPFSATETRHGDAGAERLTTELRRTLASGQVVARDDAAAIVVAVR